MCTFVRYTQTVRVGDENRRTVALRAVCRRVLQGRPFYSKGVKIFHATIIILKIVSTDTTIHNNLSILGSSIFLLDFLC